MSIALIGARYEEYGFDKKPYFGFRESRDVYGDGAIVIVPAPGHTPGSVIIFVTLPSRKRYAFVGDLVWRIEGITLREERPWLMRRLADVDEETLRSSLLRMIAIHERYPEIAIVPAHDPSAYADIPRLPSEPQRLSHH
jgi:glyoxylase-like metal-dependent hydrolase (beta-lactamase superfamily II)